MSVKDFQNSLAYARQMDEKDALRSYRSQFHFPIQKNGVPFVYLCGNSLGLQPKTTEAMLQQELLDWKNLGVEGHFEAKNPWLPYHEFLTQAMAKVVGAKPSEVVVMNTLTVNLHLMMVSFYKPEGKRNKILIEADAFPSDRYAVESQIKFHGLSPQDCLIELKAREGETCLREEEGCDFAVWCNYKYLNSGPGGMGGAFVHERHQHTKDLPRFTGWWGHNKETRFKMRDAFEPAPGVEAWQLSNPPILAMAAVWASLKMFDEVGMQKLRKKAISLTGYLEFLVESLGDDVIHIVTPSEAHQRGSQLSIQVKNENKNIFHQITEAGVIADWREPDVIRVAPTAMYNSYEDVYQFYSILKTVLQVD